MRVAYADPPYPGQAKARNEGAMIDIKEHVRQEFIDAFGEEKGTYWYDTLVWVKDERDRLAREKDQMKGWGRRFKDAIQEPDRNPE